MSNGNHTPQRPDERDHTRILLTEVARAVLVILERVEPSPHPRNISALATAIALHGEEVGDDRA